MKDTPDTTAFNIGARTGSDDLWTMAKRDFMAGESASRVCKRYDLGKSTFWAKASAEGWRRTDQPPADPVTPADLDEMADLAGHDLADLARMRLCHALTLGRSSDAAGWLRVYQDLRVRAERDDLL